MSAGAEVTGYAHPRYAASLAEFGRPRELVRSGGWILERPIPDVPDLDAIGCYPLFSCRDWSQLHADLDELGDSLVSLTVVADPFGEHDEACLKRSFKDLVVPFKEHCVADLHKVRRDAVSRHHRRYAERALRHLTVDVHPRPTEFLDEWMALHRTLVEKHHITGVRAFSRASFGIQFAVPGAVVMRALSQGEAVGTALWFIDERRDVVYGHVLGYTHAGYELGAQYALYWFGMEYFRDKVRWCSVGGVPGRGDSGADGLAWFKRGWSKDTRTAYLCGRIFNRQRYDEIARMKNASGTRYFPAYRSGEMG